MLAPWNKGTVAYVIFRKDSNNVVGDNDQNCLTIFEIIAPFVSVLLTIKCLSQPSNSVFKPGLLAPKVSFNGLMTAIAT